jgi:ferredoxin
MKKKYIDLEICLNCEFCQHRASSCFCKLNKKVVAFIFCNTKNIHVYFSSDESLISNIDENCPNKIEHFIKCSDKPFSCIKNINI